MDAGGKPRLLGGCDKDTKGPVHYDEDFLATWLVENYWGDVEHVEFIGWTPTLMIGYIYLTHAVLIPKRLQIPRFAEWKLELLYDYCNIRGGKNDLAARASPPRPIWTRSNCISF